VQRKVHDAFNARPEIRKEFAAWNALPFMSSLLPQYELMGSTQAPKALEDIKGLRVRALGGAGTALAKLGAVPYNMPASETYVAMDRGLLDGVAFPYYAYVSFRTYELGKWMTTNLSLGTTAFPLTLNLNAWNDLPQQYKTLLEDAREVAYKDQMEAVTTENQKALQTIKDAGLKLVEFGDEDLARFREIGGKPVWEGWVTDMDRRGLPGQETLDFVLKQAEEAGAHKNADK
jgi:TRAP-type C4-dicarboxylate transport system substrate-binding protein